MIFCFIKWAQSWLVSFIILAWGYDPSMQYSWKIPENHIPDWPKPCGWNCIDNEFTSYCDWGFECTSLVQVHILPVYAHHSQKVQFRFTHSSCSINYRLTMWMLKKPQMCLSRHLHQGLVSHPSRWVCSKMSNLSLLLLFITLRKILSCTNKPWNLFCY